MRKVGLGRIKFGFDVKANFFIPRSQDQLDDFFEGRDALPKATPGGARWRIFEAMESGATVKGFNQKAKAMGLGAEWDGDVFYAVRKGFARLED